jgi:hypothetical protein
MYWSHRSFFLHCIIFKKYVTSLFTLILILFIRLYICLVLRCGPYAEEHMVIRTTASYMERPYSVPVRRALYGEDPRRILQKIAGRGGV